MGWLTPRDGEDSSVDIRSDTPIDEIHWFRDSTGSSYHMKLPCTVPFIVVMKLVFEAQKQGWYPGFQVRGLHIVGNKEDYTRPAQGESEFEPPEFL